MKTVFLKIAICLSLLGLMALGIVTYVVPCLPVRWLWRSGNPDWQELAIPVLMQQIKVGMSPDEVSRLFGVSKVPPRPYMNGCETQSYNVNSWYNRGIDIIYTNGFVREVFEYD